MDFKEINKRYSELAESACCLSCGGAINHSKASVNEVCVDLGSGRGTDAIRLAESVGTGGFVYGLDISDGMIRTSKETARRFGIENIEFVKTDLENISLGNNIADLVISNCTINHASDKQAVWNEIYRILKTGGRFVVSDIYSAEKVPEEYSNDPVAVSECWAGSVTRGEYLQQLEKAGFSSIEIIEESVPYKKGKINVSSWTLYGMKSQS